MIVRRAAVIWLAMLGAALAAATLRQAVLAPRLGEPASHQLGTALAISFFLAIIWMSVSWVAPTLAPGALWQVGGVWLLATVAFEFSFGHWVAGDSWSQLVAEYNLAAGRLWLLALLTLFAAPFVFGRTKARHRRVP